MKMSECVFCIDFFILDSCVLETVKRYLKDNPIQCGDCNLHITHDCMYEHNTGSVISKHLLNHVNDHKTFVDYYEIYKREGHVSISMNVFFKKCRLLVRDTEFIAQLIPTIIEQQFCPVKSLLCSRQYIIDMQGFKISSHEFIAREFCLVATDASMMLHCMIKLPCEMQDLPLGYQKQSEWLTKFSWIIME